MSDKVKITIDNETFDYPKGVAIETLLKERGQQNDPIITLAVFNNKLCELGQPLDEDGVVSFMGIDTPNGMKTYRRSLVFLMQKAVHDLYPDEKYDVDVMHSLGEAFFCRIEGKEIDEDFVEKLKAQMVKLVEKNLPITKKTYPTHQVISIFESQGQTSKANLFKYRISSGTNIYEIVGTTDYFYGYMVPSTGYIKCFDLEVFDEGFVIKFPSIKEPGKVAEFVPPMKLYGVLKESRKWSNLMEIPTIAELNETICAGKAREVILFQEALMEEKIANMAKSISQGTVPKFIMIAGPSSSGKTTFSYRLSTQLRACGLKPHPVALDDFFINREDVPLDEYGQKDFESLRSLDIDRFNSDMTNLLEGKEVELPVYDFLAGSRKPVGRSLKLGAEDVLVIEGIHGLNDELSYTLPKESKFKIYISALNMLRIDEHNPLPTSDCRLLRRIVRDARVRGYSAKNTIKMWPSVRRGEEKNIFPFQEDADIMFNSAHIYELAVMALYAQPHLFSVKKSEPEFAEANRLLKLLNYVVPFPTDDIPINSIIREFIGGGCFGV